MGGGVGYLTIPLTSATLEGTVSALRRLKQDCLNNCQLKRCHKTITDTLGTVEIVGANKQR